VSVQSVKAYRGIRGMAPLILNFDSDGGEQLHAAAAAAAALPREITRYPLREKPSCTRTWWTGGDWLWRSGC
jgi:hypothetical protein